MHIVPIYAALLTVLFVALSVRTLRLRRRLRIVIGDAGDPRMLRATRVHSNFAEYVPLALLLLFFVEQAGTPPWALHLLGSSLLAGRLAHAYGVSRADENFAFRVFGMAMTLTELSTCSAVLLVDAARRAGA